MIGVQCFSMNTPDGSRMSYFCSGISSTPLLACTRSKDPRRRATPRAVGSRGLSGKTLNIGRDRISRVVKVAAR